MMNVRFYLFRVAVVIVVEAPVILCLPGPGCVVTPCSLLLQTTLGAVTVLCTG